MTTTHRKNVPINDEALGKRSAAVKQVFLRVPAQSRTLTLTLQGGETIQELQATISLLLGVPKRDISLTLKGAPLMTSLINADATIVILFRGLRGGTEQKAQKTDTNIKMSGGADTMTAANVNATLTMDGKKPFEFNPTKLTFAEMDAKFKEANKDLSKKKLKYFIKKETDQEEIVTNESKKKVSELDVSVEAGDIILVEEITDKTEVKVDPEDAFFKRKCPKVVAKVRQKIKNLLKTE